MRDSGLQRYADPCWNPVVTLGKLFNVSFLLHKREIGIVISRAVLIIKYDSIYATLDIRLDDNH